MHILEYGYSNTDTPIQILEYRCLNTYTRTQSLGSQHVPSPQSTVALPLNRIKDCDCEIRQ